MLNRAPVLLLTLVLALLFAGCVGDDAPPESPVEPMGAARVAMLPSLGLSYLPEHYQFVYPMVDAAVVGALREAGMTVVAEAETRALLKADDGRLLQRLRSPQSGDMEAGIVDLLDALREQGEVDALVVPQVMMRSLLMRPPYQRARWDGVSREFEIHGNRDGSQDLQLDTATLALGVFNRWGQAVYFGRGGMDFLENGVRAGERVYTSPKQEGQLEEASVTEAAGLALGPWFKALASESTSAGSIE